MLQTFEAMMEPDGSVRLLEKIKISKATKVLVTLLPAANDKIETSSIEDLFGILTATKAVSLEAMDLAQQRTKCYRSYN